MFRWKMTCDVTWLTVKQRFKSLVANLWFRSES